MSWTVTTSAASRTGGTARLGAWITSDVDAHARTAGAGANTRSGRCRAVARDRSTGSGGARPTGGRRPRTRPRRRRPPAARAGASTCSARCRREPAAAAAPRGTRPSTPVVRLRPGAWLLTRPLPRAGGSTRRAPARWRATRRSRRDRGPGRRAATAASSSLRTRSSASAKPALVGRLDEQRRVACDLRDRTGSRRDDREARAHGLEQREAEALVDRRVREHTRGVEQRAPARVVDLTCEHDALADVARESRDGGVDGGPRRAVAAGDHEPKVGMLFGERARTRSRGARGSCAAPTWRSRARTARRRRRAATGAGMRGVGAESGNAERNHDQPTGRPQPRPEDLVDLLGDELGAGVHGRRLARSRGAPAARAPVPPACTTRDTARTNSRRCSRASEAGSVARGSWSRG